MIGFHLFGGFKIGPGAVEGTLSVPRKYVRSVFLTVFPSLAPVPTVGGQVCSD